MLSIKKYENHFYFVFRILIGLLFFQHGAQKLFGWFGGQAVNIGSIMGLAGIIETAVGILVVIGLFTKIASSIAAVEMLVAYFMAHFPQGTYPLLNQGAPALLYFAAFLVLLSQGARKWGIDSYLDNR